MSFSQTLPRSMKFKIFYSLVYRGGRLIKVSTILVGLFIGAYIYMKNVHQDIKKINDYRRSYPEILNVKLIYWKKRNTTFYRNKTPRQNGCPTKPHALRQFLQKMKTYDRSYALSVNSPVLCMGPTRGRLGNGLCQYASLYGLAKRTKRIPLLDLPRYRELASKFILSDFVRPVDINPTCSTLKKYSNERHSVFDIDYFRRPFCDYVLDDPYLQNWFYFYENYDAIRRALTFKKNVLHEVSIFLNELYRRKFQNRTILIGVHYRCMDSIRLETVFGRMTPPTEYFERAMLYYRQRFGNASFIVTSDCKTFVRNEFGKLASKHGLDISFSDSTSDIFDLALLSSCHHTIINQGTFSFWAAFLNGQEAVYYPVHSKPGSSSDEHYTKHLTDYFLPYWKPMF